jgi:hypothetical protein
MQKNSNVGLLDSSIWGQTLILFQQPLTIKLLQWYSNSLFTINLAPTSVRSTSQFKTTMSVFVKLPIIVPFYFWC